MSKKLMIAALAALATGSAIANDAYSALDADQSGAISQTEAAALPGLTEQWNTLDSDTNGELSVEEFSQFEMTDAPAMEAPAAAIEAPATEASAAE
jgi:hypothetical protein